MKISVLSKEDLQVVCRLYAETFNQAPWNEKWTYEMALERFNGFMCNPQSLGYVITEENDIISCLLGHTCSFMNTLEFHVDEFFVTESIQGKGYGSRIFEQIETELRSKDIECMTLMTKRGFPSEKFYGKQGFQRIDSLIYMHKYINI